MRLCHTKRPPMLQATLHLSRKRKVWIKAKVIVHYAVETRIGSYRQRAHGFAGSGSAGGEGTGTFTLLSCAP
jgi:hypothetical protein